MRTGSVPKRLALLCGAVAVQALDAEVAVLHASGVDLVTELDWLYRRFELLVGVVVEPCGGSGEDQRKGTHGGQGDQNALPVRHVAAQD